MHHERGHCILFDCTSIIIIIPRCRRVYTWGAGRFGQLGNNLRQDKAQLQDITSSISQESGRVVQVSAGCGHSGFITDRGHAYTFGDNRYNQLGEACIKYESKSPYQGTNPIRSLRIRTSGLSHETLLCTPLTTSPCKMHSDRTFNLLDSFGRGGRF